MVRFKSASSIWEATLGDLQLQVNKTNYHTWLKDTFGLSYENHRFCVGVPNSFTSAWLENRLYSLIKRTLVKVSGDPEIEIIFIVQTERSNEHVNYGGKPLPSASVNSNLGSVNSKMPVLFSPESGTIAARLNPNYTFERFIIGDSNTLAYSAARSASESPGENNPVFIYSDNGLGKTHLLQAIAHRANDSKKSFIFVNAEKFTNEFIDALKEKRMTEFRLKYRYADILLMDDIDFMCGKEHTQEGFYHTINELHGENRQIVLTASTHFDTMPYLNNRLRSCIDGGLAVEIKRPDIKTRISILKFKAEQRGVNLLPEVIDFLASKDCENVARLEGYLNRIIEIQKIKGTLTLALAREVLEETYKIKIDKKISPEDIITKVSAKFSISIDAVTNNKKRSLELNRTRQLIIYLLREKCNCTFKEIGSLLGGKDHSSILYGYEKASLLITQEHNFRNDLEEVSKDLNLL